MRALMIGATGAVGKDLLGLLLKDPDYTAVVIFVRHPSWVEHPKRAEILTKLLNQIRFARKFKPLETALLAGKMLRAAKIYNSGRHIITLNNIFEV